MPKVSKITAAQAKIAGHFNTTRKSVYSQGELQDLIEINRGTWDLPQTTSTPRIIDKLIGNEFIKSHLFTFNNESEHLFYLYKEPSVYEIATALRAKSYISHYPAVFLHDLTTQVPKTIYTTQELSAKPNRNTNLVQSAIDKAFAQPQRRSQLITVFDDYTIVLLNGMHTNRSGVLLSTRHKNAFSYTNLERTLIDITVRPNYAGGAFAVLDAYRKAVQSNSISSNKFLATYSSIPFIYPYHQAIGFLLQKAGYTGRLLDELQNRPITYDFYLDYDMKEKSYDNTWMLWYPTGM